MKLTLDNIISQIEANIAKCKELDAQWLTLRNRRFSRLQIEVEEKLLERLKSYEAIADSAARNKDIADALTWAKENMKNVDHHVNDYAYPLYSPFGLHGIDVSQLSDNFNVETRLNKGIGTPSYRLIFDLEKRVKAENAGLEIAEVKTEEVEPVAQFTETTCLLNPDRELDRYPQYRSF
jgi:hypothetical protein